MYRETIRGNGEKKKARADLYREENADLAESERLSARFFGWRRTKISSAIVARADLAQVFEAVNSGGVAVGELNLDGVVPYGACAVGRDSRLVHRQHRSGLPALRFLLTFVIAHRAGTMITQVGKAVLAGVLV